MLPFHSMRLEAKRRLPNSFSSLLGHCATAVRIKKSGAIYRALCFWVSWCRWRSTRRGLLENVSVFKALLGSTVDTCTYASLQLIFEIFHSFSVRRGTLDLGVGSHSAFCVVNAHVHALERMKSRSPERIMECVGRL